MEVDTEEVSVVKQEPVTVKEKVLPKVEVKEEPMTIREKIAPTLEAKEEPPSESSSIGTDPPVPTEDLNQIEPSYAKWLREWYMPQRNYDPWL